MQNKGNDVEKLIISGISTSKAENLCWNKILEGLFHGTMVCLALTTNRLKEERENKVCSVMQ